MMTSVQIDCIGLSREGFTIIRNLLEGRSVTPFTFLTPWRRGLEHPAIRAAHALADVLHNLPASEDDTFRQELTARRIREFVDAFPEHQALLRYLGSTQTSLIEWEVNAENNTLFVEVPDKATLRALADQIDGLMVGRGGYNLTQEVQTQTTLTGRVGRGCFLRVAFGWPEDMAAVLDAVAELTECAASDN